MSVGVIEVWVWCVRYGFRALFGVQR